MKRATIQIKWIFLLAVIVLAALSRLLPHPPNFTPIGAMALFGVAYFDKKTMGFLLPLVALWLSDLILNNVVYAAYYEGFVWFTEGFVWIAGTFALIGLLGWATLSKVTPLRLLGTSLAASFLFFLITNFAVWLGSAMYPQTFSGLLTCYTAGIPFFWNTLAGDLFYVTVLFGSFEWVQKRYFQFSFEN